MLEIPADLDPALIPLAFLLGSWEGDGVAAGDISYRQRIEVAVVPGRPALSYVATASGADGYVSTELGFWRPGTGLTDVELVLAQADGHVELHYGSVDGYRLQTATDLVARTETGIVVTAVTRLYGRVDSDLAYVVERAGQGAGLAPYQSARLSLLP